MRHALAALLLALASSPALAATCEITVNSNDSMQFDTKEIVVDPSCTQFTVKLNHTGTLPKAAMGHNWVLSRTSDFQGVVNDGMAAGLARDYLKPDDARVLAHTRMLGGGESDSVTFDVSKLQPGTDYTFFCSFMGHWAVMKGKLRLGS